MRTLSFSQNPNLVPAGKSCGAPACGAWANTCGVVVAAAAAAPVVRTVRRLKSIIGYLLVAIATHVRFTSNSGHQSTPNRCPLSAISRNMQAANSSLFDHRVGDCEYARRN